MYFSIGQWYIDVKIQNWLDLQVHVLVVAALLVARGVYKWYKHRNQPLLGVGYPKKDWHTKG